MIIGLPLEAALNELRARGEHAAVRFTHAPRRARALESGTPAAAYTARVVKYASGVLICAYFNEPRPARAAEILPVR